MDHAFGLVVLATHMNHARVWIGHLIHNVRKSLQTAQPTEQNVLESLVVLKPTSVEDARQVQMDNVSKPFQLKELLIQFVRNTLLVMQPIT